MDNFCSPRPARITGFGFPSIVWHSSQRRPGVNRDPTARRLAKQVVKALAALLVVVALFAAAVTVKWLRLHPPILPSQSLVPASAPPARGGDAEHASG